MLLLVGGLRQLHLQLQLQMDQACTCCCCMLLSMVLILGVRHESSLVWPRRGGGHRGQRRFVALVPVHLRLLARVLDHVAALLLLLHFVFGHGHVRCALDCVEGGSEVCCPRSQTTRTMRTAYRGVKMRAQISMLCFSRSKRKIKDGIGWDARALY